MSMSQFKKDIRKARTVYAGVCVSPEDTTYIQVVKSDLLLQIASWEDNTPLNYRVEADGSLYIN
jgi:hypothetical protein